MKKEKASTDALKNQSGNESLFKYPELKDPGPMPETLHDETFYKVIAVLYSASLPMTAGMEKYALTAKEIKALVEANPVWGGKKLTFTIEEIEKICYYWPVRIGWHDPVEGNKYDFVKAIGFLLRGERYQGNGAKHER